MLSRPKHLKSIDIYSAHSYEPALVLCNYHILFIEGAPQDDSLRPLEFCKVIQPLLVGLQTYVTICIMDNITLCGDLESVDKDVVAI